MALSGQQQLSNRLSTLDLVTAEPLGRTASTPSAGPICGRVHTAITARSGCAAPSRAGTSGASPRLGAAATLAGTAARPLT